MSNGTQETKVVTTQTSNVKAYGAGVGSMIAYPVGDAMSWALQQYSGMPPEIAKGLGIALAGILVGLMTYFLPNRVIQPPDA